MNEEERELREYVEKNHPEKVKDRDFEEIFDSWIKENEDSKFGEYFNKKKSEIRIRIIGNYILNEKDDD